MEAKSTRVLRDEGFHSLERRRQNAAMIFGETAESLLPKPYVDVVIESLPALRNRFAHPGIHTIVTPGMAVDSLILTAEIINQLWAGA